MENEKKNIGVYFFMIFQLLEIKKKKDEKKKIMQKTVLGYCPNNIVEKIFCISIEGIVLQECNAKWWA